MHVENLFGFLILHAGALNLVVMFLLVVDCVRMQKSLHPYLGEGLLAGTILVTCDLALLIFLPEMDESVDVVGLVLFDVVGLVKVALAVSMGMYCCSVLHLQAFPALHRLRLRKALRDLLPPSSLLVFFGCVLLCAAYSALLLKIAGPRMAAWLQELSRVQTARMGLGTGTSPVLILAALLPAFGEELIFRLGIQNYLSLRLNLRGGDYWAAVVMTAGLWSLLHGNLLEPAWVKPVQVFPLGVLLGFLFRRYGTEACILVHGAFNLVMIPLQPLLIPAAA